MYDLKERPSIVVIWAVVRYDASGSGVQPQYVTVVKPVSERDVVVMVASCKSGMVAFPMMLRHDVSTPGSGQ